MTWTAGELAERLGARRNGVGWMAPCPAHDDRTPSLSINENGTGKPLVKCHAGCDQAAVWDAVEKCMGSENGTRKRAPAPARLGEIVAEYDYRDENGQLLYQVVRDAAKQFRQRRPNASQGTGEPAWTYNMDGVTRVLYRLPEVVVAVAMQRDGKFPKPIFIVEGEKDANAVAALGLVATCNSGGAGKWRPELTETLRGARKVVILPDNDEPGRQHARSVVASLTGAVESVAVLTMPGLPDKGDASDWISQGGTKAELLRIAELATTEDESAERFVKASRSLRTMIDDNRPMPPSLLGDGLITAGSLSILGGMPGLGKSWLTLQLAAAISTGTPFLGIDTRKSRVGIIGLELPEQMLVRRMKAVATLLPEGTGEEWREIPVVCRPNLGGPVDLGGKADADALKRWINDNALDLVIVDPLSRVHTANENDAAEVSAFLANVEAARLESGTALLIVHHDRKPSSSANPDEDGLASLRGSGRFISDPTTVMRLARGGKQPDGTKVRRLSFEKVNFGPTPHDTYLVHGEGGPMIETEKPTRGDGGKETPAPVLILEALRAAGRSTIDQLAAVTGLHRSTVSKAMKGFVSDGLTVGDGAKPEFFRLTTPSE